MLKASAYENPWMDELPMTDEQCYAAVLRRDRRFDGVFFVGVSSTGIYCRTVCSAKMPRPENCTFYACAAAAEQAGYRPCLRCRPELAPGQARIDAVGRLAIAIFAVSFNKNIVLKLLFEQS